MSDRRLIINFGDGNPNNRTLHLLAEVDGMVVCKCWSRRRQEWIYSVEHPRYIAMLKESGEAVESRRGFSERARIQAG